MELKKEYQYILDLIAYSIFNIPCSLRDDIDEKTFYIKTTEQKMNCFVFDALSKLKAKEDKLYQLLKRNTLKAVQQATIQENELRALSKTFKGNNVPVVFLKGSETRFLYPVPDYRIMGDIDILIQEKDRDKVKSLLSQLGYKIGEKSDTHDAFSKQFLEVEVHHHLFRNNDKVGEFFNSPWQHVVDNFSFDYNYSFVYQVSHLAKHFKNGGAGFKSVLDLGIYINKYKDKLNFNLIKQMLDKIGYYDFYNSIISVFVYAFKTPLDFNYIKISDEEIIAIINHIFKVGEFGHGMENKPLIQTTSLYIASTKKGLFWGKVSYVIKNICLPYKVFKSRSKIIKYCPILLPFGWVCRFFRILFTKNKTLKEHLQAINQIDKELIEDANVIVNILKIKE